MNRLLTLHVKLISELINSGFILSLYKGFKFFTLKTFWYTQLMKLCSIVILG